MSCSAEIEKHYDAQIFAEGFRILLGLTLMFVGLYIGTLSNVQEHGLGFLLVFGSPFIMLTDGK